MLFLFCFVLMFCTTNIVVTCTAIHVCFLYGFVALNVQQVELNLKTLNVFYSHTAMLDRTIICYLRCTVPFCDFRLTIRLPLVS